MNYLKKLYSWWKKRKVEPFLSEYSDYEIKKLKALFNLKINIQNQNFIFDSYAEARYIDYWKNKSKNTLPLNYISCYMNMTSGLDSKNIFKFIDVDIENIKHEIKHKPTFRDDDGLLYGLIPTTDAIFVYLCNLPVRLGQNKFKTAESISDDEFETIKLLIESADYFEYIGSFTILNMLLRNSPEIFVNENRREWLFEHIMNREQSSITYLIQNVMMFQSGCLIKGSFFKYCMDNHPRTMIAEYPHLIPDEKISYLLYKYPRDFYESEYFRRDDLVFKKILSALLLSDNSYNTGILIWILANENKRLTIEEIQNIIGFCEKHQYYDFIIPTLPPEVYKNGGYEFKLHKDIVGNIIDQNYCEKYYGGRLYVKDGITVQEPFIFSEYMKRLNEKLDN